MNKATLLFLFSIFATILFAQEKTNNQCGSIRYDYKIPSEHEVRKEAELYFNEATSKFIFDKYTSSDGVRSTIEAKDDNSLHVTFATGDEQGSCVYRNYDEEKIVVRGAKTAKLFDDYLYEDTWVDIDWKIGSQKKVIANFTCTKATAQFRGRKYTAWFTEEIPLPYGPWKLHGLPGLILEAEDSEKMFKASVTSIQYPIVCDDNLLVTPTATETKTLQEYVSFMDNYNDRVFAKMQSRRPRELAARITQIKKPDVGRKYRAEKVYEWE